MKKKLTLSERLNQSFAINERGCHEWRKALSKKGYGVIGVGSRLDKSRKIIYAHRLSWELHHNKSIPNGLFVLHKCDNRLCINVDHLFLGTAKDNTKDMINKNREANKKGIIPINFIKHIKEVKEGKFSKLSLCQVKEIKELILNNIHNSVIADKYCVSISCISDIKRKATWINV